MSTSAWGLLLAAGAGRRMGQPKALVRAADGRPWLHTGITALRDGGCGHVLVVLGAAAPEARALLDDLSVEDVTVVVADDWAEGMSASLRAGLRAAQQRHAAGARFGAVAVTLVDLPDVDERVVARVLDVVGTRPSALGRAVFGGLPGHPVLLGADHLDPALSTMTGDEGARAYLREHAHTDVECGDLATGVDVDSR